jgi:hypothetical protein
MLQRQEDVVIIDSWPEADQAADNAPTASLASPLEGPKIVKSRGEASHKRNHIAISRHTEKPEVLQTISSEKNSNR